MQCANHPQFAAAGMCIYCGKPFCKECLVDIKGKMYCRADLGNVMDEIKGSSSGTPAISITNTSSNANENTASVTSVAGGFGIGIPPRSKMTALLLCIFLGGFGAHRFYVGKIGTGIIWLFTLGLFGVGYIVDLIMIIAGAFRDNFGRPLV